MADFQVEKGDFDPRSQAGEWLRRLMEKEGSMLIDVPYQASNPLISWLGVASSLSLLGGQPLMLLKSIPRPGSSDPRKAYFLGITPETHSHLGAIVGTLLPISFCSKYYTDNHLSSDCLKKALNL